jgi:hypothetical protein
MKPVDFPEKNFTYTKPAGWTDEQCGDLPVWKGDVPLDTAGNTTPAIISRWEKELTDAEIDEIVRTRRMGVWVNICSNGMPPISIYTEKPFVQSEQMAG